MPSIQHSKDVTTCPGYKLVQLNKTRDGLIAQLELAGEPSNAFGNDITKLVLEVEYQTKERLHVHIYDAEKEQYQIAKSIWPRPANEAPDQCDLEFNYEEDPFAFWITRASNGEVLFDTRASNIPVYNEPIIFDGKPMRDSTTAAYPLVFSDQYLQLATAMPQDTNVYGLGEVIATSGFRRDNKNGCVSTMWNRDSGGSPTDQNLYSAHAMYLETRWGQFDGKVIITRVLGGTFDMYFLSGPTTQHVVRQYSGVVGLPARIPDWAFGFHLCRWGGDWKSLESLRGVVERMRKEGIPLETIWSDMDYADRFRDFTVNDLYKPEDFREFTKWLHDQHQHWIPIVDAAIAYIEDPNEDPYEAYELGHKLDVFIKDANGSEYIGKVWPGKTVFPDWTAPNVYQWWKHCFDSFREIANYDGIWLDMNEPASLPTPEDVAWKEEIVAHGVFGETAAQRGSTLVSQEPGEIGDKWGFPPYAIHQGWKHLGSLTVAASAKLSDGTRHYHSHNLFGFKENIETRKVLLEQEPDKRPFIVSRSSFAGQGRISAHWLGDNYSTFKSMRESVQGVLQFQLFQMPMVGPDACGFLQPAEEELCSRWMQLSAFYPFYRNHNARRATPQEPYLWQSVIDATKITMRIRYQLLPVWESLFASASRDGTPPVRPLFWEFDDVRLAAVDRQFLVGPGLLITPVLDEGATTVEGYFPKHGGPWRDWYTRKSLEVDENDRALLQSPLGHLPLHIRAGTVLLIYNDPQYTLTETKRTSQGLLVSLNDDGEAAGEFHLDDGQSLSDKSSTVTFTVKNSQITVTSRGDYVPCQKITEMTFLGIREKPDTVSVQGTAAEAWSYDSDVEALQITKKSIGLEPGSHCVAAAW